MTAKKKLKLGHYSAKRSFTRTPEPEPKISAARSGPLLYMVQKHAARRLHYDFRLELDGVLKSWAIPKGPSLDPREKRLAVETEDHPFDYAAFEGVIPEKQYGAGNVIVWDAGVYSPDEGGEYTYADRRAAEARVRQELDQGKLSLFIRGEKVKGSFALVRTSTPKQWLLIKHKDQFADGHDVLSDAASVLSGRTLDEIPSPGLRSTSPKGRGERTPLLRGEGDGVGEVEGIPSPGLRPTSPKGRGERIPLLRGEGDGVGEVKGIPSSGLRPTSPQGRSSSSSPQPPAATLAVTAARLGPHGPREDLPHQLLPMLAEIGEVADTEPGWTYEPKLDGYRVIAFTERDRVFLQSRRGQDYTAFFPEIVADLKLQAADSMILDGEVVALDDNGRPSFNALQNRAQLKTATEITKAMQDSPVVYVCFDILHFAGMNLRTSPYVDRRRYLKQCALPTRHLQIVHTSHDAQMLYEAALASGFEGIVAKRNDSPYFPGQRGKSWLKIKEVQTGDFVVGGYTRGKGAREDLGSLLLGYYRGKKFIYAGHVGSGLNHRWLTQLGRQLKEAARPTSPYSTKPDLHRPTTWVEPRTVVEVKYAGWTPDGNLRAPVFLRTREDLEPMAIRHNPSTGGSTKPPSPGQRPTSPKGRGGRTPLLRGEGDGVGEVEDRLSPARRATSPKGRGSGPSPQAPVPSPELIADTLDQLKSPTDKLELLVGDEKIRLTHLNREYWPANLKAKQAAVTKRDLIRYLACVSPYMLPHLQDRPLTMIRMPAGIHGERFFQKHWDAAKPDFVETIRVYSGSKDEKQEYIVANNLPTLLWLAQNGTLEFHVWHSRDHVSPDCSSQSTDYSSSLKALESSVLNYPDWLVFDIDPYIYSGKEAKGAEPELNKKGFAGGRKVAFWLHELLKEMGLDAIVKTSGKTGLHVFVPIERTVTFDHARQICEMVGRHLLRQHPKEITMEWATVKRTGKIFIDYNMNVRAKTLNVAYSPRGVAGAPISMPLTWEELEAAEPMQYTMANVLSRLEKTGDRWHDALDSKQSLGRALGLLTND